MLNDEFENRRMSQETSQTSGSTCAHVASVAIVGSGAVAHHHARHLVNCPTTRLVAIVDTDRSAAEAFALKYSISRVHNSLSELFAAGGVDALHISTPPDSHEILARQAIDHGLDVVVEKPIAYSAAVTAELYQLAAARGVRLSPDYSLFLAEQMCLARKWIAEDRIGSIVGVECLYQTTLDRARLEEPKRPPWLFELPAGPLHNFFTHPLYLVLQFTGPVRGVNSVPRHAGYLPQGLTDNLDLLIDGTNCSAFVNVSLAARPAQTRLVIQGEQGRIAIDFDAFQITLERAPARFGSVMRLLRPSLRGIGAVRQTGSTALKILRKRLVPYAGLKTLIEQFYSSSPPGGKLPIPPELVLSVARVEEEIVRSPGVWKLSFPRASSVVPDGPHSKWVAVTGGTGYLGSRVVAELRNRGYGVRLLQRWQSHGALPAGDDIEVVYGDARNVDDVRRLVAGTEAVVHMAAGMKGSREFVVESCAEAARNVVQVARELGTRRNIYLSSMAVFDYRGLKRRDFLSEGTALEAAPEERSAYGMGKTLAERIVAEEIARNHSPWMILRPSQIFGETADFAHHLGSILGRNVLSLGGPRKRMRLVHVADVVRAIVDFIAPEKFQSGTVLNLTHPDILLAWQVAALLKQRCGVDVVYLRPSVGRALAWATRVTHTMLKRGPRISARQAAYLFCESGAEAKAALELGWRPAATLKEQIQAALTGSVRNSTK
ncbi:MAG: NAD-dependent epimerase/dehydratase family protein [Verrucomicrobiota bacterium]|jgi:predicted dehydrogenase/nucleoside-diphosphate-sugar epimerase